MIAFAVAGFGAPGHGRLQGRLCNWIAKRSVTLRPWCWECHWNLEQNRNSGRMPAWTG